jgi:23S rRNA pseudouridine1911/1915/1917 synthase
MVVDRFPLEFEVSTEAAGIRLDRFLAEPLGSRAQAQSLIDAGLVHVDGQPRAKRHIVRAGQRVAVLANAAAKAGDGGSDGAGPEVPYTVRWEDDSLLVVDKPAGVVVHPARGHRTGTLAQALRARGAGGGEEPERAGIVHRLDRDTSGLLVVAKNDAVHRALKELLASRGLRREYLALVEGHPPARTGTIDAPIGRHRRDRVLMSIDTDDPREARTHYEIEQLLPGSSLLRVVLDTGRTHQIRVHLAAISHPVCGDPQYGTRGLYGLRRQFLHATRLAFTHPVTGASVDVTSPLPNDLVAALERAKLSSS